MKDAVIKRLASFGFTISAGDGWALDFIIQKVENHIRDSCNIRDIPEELFEVEVDMVVGEFLQGKKSSGRLDGFEFEAEAAVKQIQEGDTSVTFALGEGSLTPEQRVDRLIEALLSGGRGQLVAHRRIQW